MNPLRFVSTLLAMLTLAVAVATAQPKPAAPKSPADLAAEDFFKLRDDREAKPGEARFQQVIKAGLEFVVKNPTHARTGAVVNSLGTFGNTISDKKLAAYRGSYVAALKLEVLNARTADGVTPETAAALAALDAAAADFETREEFSRETLTALREKIDTLAALPGAARFLTERERSYIEILMRGGQARTGEAHARKLLESPDKAVAAMAREELNLIEVKQAPYELKFTALDGKACDLAALRGKVVALVFFTAGSDAAVKVVATAREVQSLFGKGLAVVGVSFDKEADREKVVKWVKDQALRWPVHFDGLEAKNAWAPKLNVRRTPAIVLFDQKGILVTNNQRADRLEADVKRLLGIK